MSTPAPKEMMRYGMMRDWLKTRGISEYEVLKLIDAGTIRKGFLRKPKKKKGGVKKCHRVKAWYSASQIEHAVLNGAGTNANAQESRKTGT